MPDGDKFERQLIGKGWRRAYRLACKKEDSSDLIPILRNALDHSLKNGLECPTLDEIGNTIFESLNQPLFATVDSVNLQYQFSQHLEALAISQSSFPGTRIAVDAAKVVYIELSSSDHLVTLEQVKRQLYKTFEERVLNNQFFSKCREGIRKETCRSLEEQNEWERRQTDEVISYKRTERRWQSIQSWDIEILRQPIEVLEG